MGLIKPISMTEVSGNIKLTKEWKQMFPNTAVYIPAGETATLTKVAGVENYLMTNFPFDSGMWTCSRVLPIEVNMLNMTLRNIQPDTEDYPAETAQLTGVDVSTQIQVYRREGIA